MLAGSAHKQTFENKVSGIRSLRNKLPLRRTSTIYNSVISSVYVPLAQLADIGKSVVQQKMFISVCGLWKACHPVIRDMGEHVCWKLDTLLHTHAFVIPLLELSGVWYHYY